MNSPAVAACWALVVEDTPAWGRHLAELIRQACPSARVHLARNYQEANEALNSDTPWMLVATDVALSRSDTKGLGLTILRRARDRDLPVAVVSITEIVRARGAAAAERCGARYFSKWQLTNEDHVQREFLDYVRQALRRPQKPVKLFLSYAHEDQPLCQQLEWHLASLERQGLIRLWNDRRLRPGEEWAVQIGKHLEQAPLILLLISSYFIKSHYCHDVEMEYAMGRHKAGQARVIPVILRPCNWRSMPLAALHALPRHGKPVTSWANSDEAFLDVTQGVHHAAMSFFLGS